MPTQTKVIRLSDAVWSFAELGMQEHRSLKVITDYLRSEGFKVETVWPNAHGLYGLLGNGKPGIGFVVEYDALPMINNSPSQERSVC